MKLLEPRIINVSSGYPGRRLASRPPPFVWIPTVIVLAAMIVPLGYLVLRTIGAGTETFDLIFRQRTFDILTRSLLLMGSVSISAILIAVPIGWLTIKTDLPFRRIFSVITILPLVIPSYIGAFILVIFLSPKGILQGWLAPLGIDRLPEIYGFPGAFLTLTLLTYPYVLLPVRAALIRLDWSTYQASLTLGVTPIRTFIRITLPMLRPAIATGALLVGLYALSDFGAVSLLHYETFTWAIYIQYGSFAREVAAALSVVLIILAICLLYMESRTRGRAKYYNVSTGTHTRQKSIQLGIWRWPAVLFCISVVSFSLIMPVSILVYWVIRGISFGEQVAIPWSQLINTLYVSGLAALVAVAAALPIVIFSIRYPGRISTLLERCSYIGFALPGIVVALSLVFFVIRYATPLYQTLPLLIFSYLILFLPASLSSINASFLQVNPKLEEAARILGRSPLKAFGTITLPLLVPGLLAGGSLVFLLAMKELPATLLLSPIGFKTLATSIWWATEDAFFTKAAVPALLLIIASTIPMTFLVSLDQKEEVS